MATRERNVRYNCPHCAEQITRIPDNHAHYTCPRCRVRYLVMIDENTGATAFVDQTTRPSAPPLGLPKGSIRAMVALAMGGACTMLVATGHDVPGSLGSLLLAIIGFYFGFRTKGATLGDRIYDPAARRERPLYLPAGLIRTLLIAGVLAMAVVLLSRKRMLDVPAHLEFFVVLAGLIVGHYFSKAFRGIRSGGVGHVKALFVLAVAAGVTVIFLTGRYEAMPNTTMLLCAGVSFYFGSRS